MILLTLLAVFHPVCSFDFTGYDDNGNVGTNPDFNPVTLASLSNYWTGPHMDMYIPVAYTTWAAVASISRVKAADGTWILDPSLFHAANLVFHAGASLLVYFILRKLSLAKWPACIGTLFFAVHPLQVEAVAWVSGLRDVLGGALALAATLLYLHYLDRHQRRFYLLGLLLFALSLLSKPSAMSLPLALAAIDYLHYHRPARQVINAAAGWLAVAIAVAILTKLVQPTSTMIGAPLWSRPLIALDALTTYGEQLLLPLKLGIDYGRSPEWLLAHPALYWTWLPAAAVGGLLLFNYRRWPTAACAAAIFVALLLPVLGLVKFEFQRHSTVADRYAYLALLGPALLIAFLLNHRRLTFPVVSGIAIVLTLYGTRAYAQVLTWKDSYAVFSHTLEVNPSSLAGNNWLGLYEAQSGHPDRAIIYYHTTLAAHPGDAVTNYNLGDLLLNIGHPAEAVPYLRQGLTGRGEWFIHFKLAVALAKSGDPDAALAACRAGIARWPQAAELHEMEAALLAERQEWSAARDAYATALALNPKLQHARRMLAEVNRHLATRPSQP